VIPYYEDDAVTIYLGDCREMVASLPTPAVTIADPPYGETSLEWDCWVPGWPALMPGSCLWCFGSMRMFLEHAREFAGWKFGQDLVWEKHNGSGFHADRFKRVHENIVHWYRGAWSVQTLQVPSTLDAIQRSVVRKKGRPQHMGHIEQTPFRSEDGGPRLMRSVIQVPSCHGYAQHPTQKPLGILSPLITFSCPVGGLVLEPFMGSGSSLVAAKQLGRRATGIEAREAYCEVAAGRLQQEVLAL